MNQRTRWVFTQVPCADLNDDHTTINVEVDWEANIHEVMDAFERFLRATGWHEDTIRKGVIEWADDRCRTQAPTVSEGDE